MAELTGTLTRLDGPECPGCGCRDCVEIRRQNKGWMVVSIMRCRYCRQAFRRSRMIRQASRREEADADGEQIGDGKDAGPGGAVVYRPVLCPDCGSRRTKVTRTMSPTRYHKCDECGKRFKSVEE